MVTGQGRKGIPLLLQGSGPVSVLNGFPGTLAVPAKTAFSDLTTKAFCMEQGNIRYIFCANLTSTAFCIIRLQGKHTLPKLGKHPKFPSWYNPPG